MDRLVDGVGNAWAAHYADSGGLRMWPNTELVAFAAGRRFERVLEAGCGAGANLRPFLGLSQAVGLDAYLPVLATARWCANVVCGDVRHLPFASGSFDLVVDCLTSQHLPWREHARLYREYRRVVGHRGWLWLCHLDDDTQSERVGKSQNGYDWRGLAMFPSVPLFCLPDKRTLADEVRRAGFEVERRGWAREYPSGEVAHYTVIEGEAI